MKLPNGEYALVDIRKLSEYCLNMHHLRGRNKARVFAAVGITSNDAEQLRSALLLAAKEGDAEIGAATQWGQRYVIDFEFIHEGKAVRIRSAWIVRTAENLPYLTTCYVL
jgi:hypothetical protein